MNYYNRIFEIHFEIWGFYALRMNKNKSMKIPLLYEVQFNCFEELPTCKGFCYKFLS